MKLKNWNDFIFEIASNDEVYQDIDESIWQADY